MEALRVIGDIGGTNARFALASGGVYSHLEHLPVADHPFFQDALRAYLDTLPHGLRPGAGAFAVAGLVAGGRAVLTNSRWDLSAEQVAAHFGLSAVAVVNDFAGTALGMPFLGEADRIPIGPAVPAAPGPIAVIGPGTGLGMSGLVPNGAGWTLVSGEGGRATMPAATHHESAVLGYLRDRWDHLSAERVLSGAGLVNLYGACCALAGRRASLASPAEVAARALDGNDEDCTLAAGLFCAMLGTVAGNLALTLGTVGGVHVTGGIAPRLSSILLDSLFRERFEGKGRLKRYMQAIPTYLVFDTHAALLGLANLPLAAPEPGQDSAMPRGASGT